MLPSSRPTAARSPGGESAAAPATGNVRTGRKVRESSKSERLSPLVTRRKRPSRVKPTRRPPGMGRDRRSGRPSAARRSTSTWSGGDVAPETASPVTSVRPSGANVTSAVTALSGDVAVARARCVRRSTRNTRAWMPSLSPTASVRLSGLKARARTGRARPPKLLIWSLDVNRGPTSRSVRVSKNATLPLSPRAASVLPSALSASSRTRAPAAVQHCQRRRTAKERGEQVAPRRERVVEVGAFAREQQRAVESRLDECLGAETLRDRGGRLVFAVPRAASATAPATSAATSRASATASSARTRRVARAKAARLSSRNSRSSRFSPASSADASAHSSAAARRAPR